MKSRTTRYRFIAFGVVVLLLLAVPAVWFAIYFGGSLYHFSHPESIRLDVPNTRISLFHTRALRRPMAAEYDRSLGYSMRSTYPGNFRMAVDTGGGYPLNCYLIQTENRTLLRMEDAISEYLVNLTDWKVYAIARVNDVPYYANYNSVDFATESWTVSVDPEISTVTINGTPAKPLSRLIGEANEEYVGAIDGPVGQLHFFPADELPEQKIQHKKQ